MRLPTQPIAQGREKGGANPRPGGPKAHQMVRHPLLPLLAAAPPIWGAAAPPRVGTLGLAPPLPSPYIYRALLAIEIHGFSLSLSAQPCSSPSSSLPALGEALPGDLVSPPTPRRRVAGLLPQPLPPPCWIKVRETSPGCTCVERGGAVVRH